MKIKAILLLSFLFVSGSTMAQRNRLGAKKIDHFSTTTESPNVVVSSQQNNNTTQSSSHNGTQTITQPCTICQGGKTCRVCFGRGGTMGAAYGGMWYTCTSCLGSGVCQFCRGQGYVTTQIVTDGRGNATAISSNGYVSSGNAGGAMVTSPNGSTHAHPKGGSSSSSSRSSSSRSSSSTSKPVDITHYGTDYTGSDNRYWCEKCHKWSVSRHSHQTIR